MKTVIMRRPTGSVFLSQVVRCLKKKNPAHPGNEKLICDLLVSGIQASDSSTPAQGVISES